MDAFSLLKFWKGGGGGAAAAAAGFLPETAASNLRSSADLAGATNTTTIVTSVSETDADDDDDADTDAGGDDEGPFFDLEFAVPVEDEEGEGDHEVSETEEDGSGGDGEGGGEGGDSDGTDGGGEFKFTLSSGSGGDEREDPNLSLSPSDDLFFKGRLVAVEPPSSTGAEQCSAAKAAAAQFSASFLKSATKFRVFMLGLKKSKLNQAKPEKQEANSGSGDVDDKQQPPGPPPQQQKSTFTVKFKVEEVPVISLFTRDSSSRNSSSSSSSSSSSKKQNGHEPAVSDEKRFLMMQKYLKKVKPLYVRVSRRYGEKLRFSGQLSFGSAPSSAARSTAEKDRAEKTEAPAKSQKQGSLNISIPAGLKVVRKHLGKSRSASSVTPPPQTSTATAVATPVTSKRRDDSLLQQQDGIQSAILHCKRSFNSSRDGDASVLPRSVSDPST